MSPLPYRRSKTATAGDTLNGFKYLAKWRMVLFPAFEKILTAMWRRQQAHLPDAPIRARSYSVPPKLLHHLLTRLLWFLFQYQPHHLFHVFVTFACLKLIQWSFTRCFTKYMRNFFSSSGESVPPLTLTLTQTGQPWKKLCLALSCWVQKGALNLSGSITCLYFHNGWSTGASLIMWWTNRPRRLWSLFQAPIMKVSALTKGLLKLAIMQLRIGP